jgi:hypothetical protein
MIAQQTNTDGAVAVHTPGKALSIKAWQEAARAAATKERMAPGEWRIQSARHADVFYTVTVHLASGTSTCNCPAGSYGRDCHHALYAEAQERLIVQAEHAALKAQMRRDLALLAAGYDEHQGLFHLALQEYAEEVIW